MSFISKQCQNNNNNNNTNNYKYHWCINNSDYTLAERLLLISFTSIVHLYCFITLNIVILFDYLYRSIIHVLYAGH